MRFSLLLVFFMLSLQIASAQENPSPVITIDNAQSLAPLYTINEEFFMASFSQFEHYGTAVLLVDSAESDDNPPMESTIRTWDLETQEITNTINFEVYGAIYSPMQIPRYSRFVTSSVGGNVSLHTYPSGQINLQFSSSSIYYTLANISADGRRLVYTECVWRQQGPGCYSETWFFLIYDTNTFELISMLDYDLDFFAELNGFSAQALALSETGQYLLIEGTTQLSIFDTRSEERVLLDESGCRVNHASFISETTILAVKPPCDETTEYRIVEWDFVTGEERSIFSYSDSELRFMKLSPDRTILSVLTSSKLYLVNFATGEILNEIEFVTREFTFDFSPDGRYLLLGNIIYGLEN
jgi:hypothetical protein